MAQSKWDDIIRACLNPDAPIDDETLKHLMEVCGDPQRFSEFIMALEQNEEGALGSKAAALLRMLRGVIDLVGRTDPGKLEPMLKNIAQGFGTLTPELLLELLSTDEGRADKAADLVLQIASRMNDATLGNFVAKSIVSKGGATTRLAQAFQALVPEPDRRAGLLDIARAQVAQSPLGSSDDFLDIWKNAADMLTSYSDEQFVSESYARELSGARTQAIEVERVSDDPPERIGGWVSSVGPAEVRALDLRLMLDLLNIEADPQRWQTLIKPVISHVDDCLHDWRFRCGRRTGARPRRRSQERRAKETRGNGRARDPCRRIDDDARRVAPANGRRCHRGEAERASAPGRPVGAEDPGRGPRGRKAGGRAPAIYADSSWLRRRPDATPSNSCAGRPIRRCVEPPSTCCASSAEPRRCPT